MKLDSLYYKELENGNKQHQITVAVPNVCLDSFPAREAGRGGDAHAHAAVLVPNLPALPQGRLSCSPAAPWDAVSLLQQVRKGQRSPAQLLLPQVSRGVLAQPWLSISELQMVGET